MGLLLLSGDGPLVIVSSLLTIIHQVSTCIDFIRLESVEARWIELMEAGWNYLQMEGLLSCCSKSEDGSKERDEMDEAEEEAEVEEGTGVGSCDSGSG